MLISFLNILYKKPKDYQLLWLYILGHINDGSQSYISLIELKKTFRFNKTKFYRILRFGLPFFNIKSNGIYIVSNNGYLVIEVIRNVKEKSKEKTIKNNNKLIENVITFLNKKTNKNYTLKSRKTISCINARINEGFDEKDFLKVIEIKTNKWMGTQMEEYLRPITLFGNKMDSYLNETNNKKVTNERFAKTQSAVDQAKQIDWFSQK
tara:strand:- start:1894 stop:2517 length:624 start_codon:yes stop_codon:yes gene_type:complete